MSFILKLGTTILTLRNPEEGNSERLLPSDIRRYTRSGNFLGTSDTSHWTVVRSRVYKFKAITNVLHDPPDAATDYLIDQLKDFLKESAGKEISFKDRTEGWVSGYIYTPVNEIISERPNCTFDVSIELLEKPAVLS